VVPSAFRQPEIVPSSETNRKLSPLNGLIRPPVVLTWPVTDPSPGIVTVRPSLVGTSDAFTE
jgi:hypothetical protein